MVNFIYAFFLDKLDLRRRKKNESNKSYSNRFEWHTSHRQRNRARLYRGSQKVHTHTNT